VAFITADDLLTKTQKSWTHGLHLSESDGDAAYIATVITEVEAWVQLDLADDFEPPTPDNDETIELDGKGERRLYIPRRVRSLTTVKTRDLNGVLTLEDSTTYRLHSSLNSTGTAMGLDGVGRPSKVDWLDVISGRTLTTGVWPWGSQTVQLVGKFGWAAVPTDIKRLTALLVYDRVKPLNNHLRKAEKLQTDQASIIYVNADDPDSTGIPEADRIRRLYARSRKAYVA